MTETGPKVKFQWDFATTRVGEAEMTDAPEKIWAWTSPRDEDPNCFWTTGVVNSPTKAQYTRTDLAEAAERAEYLRGLEDAGAAVRNACNCDSALDAIRALAKEGGE